MGYDVSWDLPHVVQTEDSWQESDCYWWFDAAAGVGGWHRVGQYPNLGTGQSNVFLYEIGGQRFLDRRIDVPGSECVRTDRGQRVGKSMVDCLAPQEMQYRYAASEAEFDLTFSDSFYEPRDWVSADRAGKALATETGHLEVAGKLRGTVRIGDRAFKIDALAHRDRSWGPRNLYGLDVLWFCNGSAGPELSWAAMDVRLDNGQKRTVGYIARGTVTEDITSCEVNILTAADGLTPLRGFMTLSSASGSIDLDIQTVQGFMQRIAPGPFIALDQSSRVFVNGKEGFADFAVVQNALHGEYMPSTRAELTITCIEEGLTDFQPHAPALAPGAARMLGIKP